MVGGPCGFSNGTMYADNVDFSGNTAPSPQVTLNGQLLIGSTATPNIRVSTLTPGTGIVITNGAGSITIAASGSVTGLWTDESGNFSAIASNGYMSTGAGNIIGTLPGAGSANGTTIEFSVTGTGTLTITPSTSDKIRMDTVLSTNGTGGGKAVSTSQGSSARLVYQSSSGIWQAVSFNGNWTIT